MNLDLKPAGLVARRERLRERRPLVFRHSLALLISVASVGLTWIFWPFLRHTPHSVYYAGVALSAWWCGLQGALITTAICSAFALLVSRPETASRVIGREDLLWIGAFLVVATLIHLLAGSRRQGESAARSSGALLQTTLSGVAEGVIALDREGRVTLLNPVAQALTGWGQEEAAGLALDRIFRTADGESSPPSVHGLRLAIAAGKVSALEGERLLVARDGSRRPIRCRATAIRGRRGAPLGAVLCFRDLTEWRRLEESIRENEHELADFFENSAMGLHWLGPGGTILRANQAELDLLGYLSHEYVGRSIREFHVDPVVIDDILRRLALGETLRNHEARLRAKDGAIKHVLIDSNVLWRDGKFIHSRCFTRDITERKLGELALQRAKEEAESALRAKDQLLATLSHELRTPLTPVLIAATQFESAEALPAEFREAIDLIRRNVELEARLIDDLLDLTRITRGKLELNLQTVNVHLLVRNVLEICRSDLLAKRFAVQVELNARRPNVRGDPARLQQVLWNLLKNAIKFTQAGGSIRIVTQDEERLLKVQVVDDGIGIESETLPRIFDAFEQGDGAAHREHGGLGLGLSIARALVAAHGGKITAESSGKGQGSRFTFWLGSVDGPAPEEPARAAPPAGEAPREQPLSILLVEDHEDTAAYLSLLLRRQRYRVRTAGSMAHAIEEAQKEPFDLLISDLGLPDGSGLDLMRRLSAAGRNRGIALSGFGTDADIRLCREAGFCEHLTKPIDFQKLLMTIKSLAVERS